MSSFTSRFCLVSFEDGQMKLSLNRYESLDKNTTFSQILQTTSIAQIVHQLVCLPEVPMVRLADEQGIEG